ncbi:hypothetical protein [Phaeobacter inhibens]|uniref:hypothetical protein n=1 Tax=Phaeobacter inhibens TaxID=221822 RepID=UPI0021A767B8|nr:hypothetical protein [Phaeobacter inhibens]UWR62794.1 hypothetical protein K4F88_19145 [Phaeobacter inhibens]
MAAALVVLSGTTGQGSELETNMVLDCTIRPLSQGHWMPGQLSIQLDTQRNLANVSGFDPAHSLDSFVPVALERKSETTFALIWRGHAQPGQKVDELQYRAVLNTQNQKFTLTVSETGKDDPPQRGIGSCNRGG